MIVTTRRRSSAIATSPQRSGVGVPAQWPLPRFQFGDRVCLRSAPSDRGTVIGMDYTPKALADEWQVNQGWAYLVALDKGAPSTRFDHWETWHERDLTLVNPGGTGGHSP